MSTQDFSPVTEQGVAAPLPRFRERIKGVAPDGPAPQAGIEVVWFDRDDRVLAGSPTAGERRNNGARRWVAIDVRPHDVDFALDLKDPTGRVGLEARVGLSVQVRRGSAAEVAQNGLTSVRAAVLPKVQRAVAATQSELDVREDGDRDDPAAFQRLRAQTTEVLWQQLERQLDYLPTWLNAEISSVVVELDAAAGAHTTALVSTEHDGRQAAARTASKLGAMDEVAERLLPRLSDPHQRIFIKALMDPSADNIDEAIALAAQAENETAGYMLQLVHRLLDGDYIDKSDPVYASLVAVVDGSLQQLGRATHLTALGTGEQAGEPRAPREHGDAQTVEGEIVQEAGDTDFTDGGANDDREAS